MQFSVCFLFCSAIFSSLSFLPYLFKFILILLLKELTLLLGPYWHYFFIFHFSWTSFSIWYLIFYLKTYSLFTFFQHHDIFIVVASQFTCFWRTKCVRSLTSCRTGNNKCILKNIINKLMIRWDEEQTKRLSRSTWSTLAKLTESHPRSPARE